MSVDWGWVINQYIHRLLSCIIDMVLDIEYVNMVI